jgi:hypothetical protein
MRSHVWLTPIFTNSYRTFVRKATGETANDACSSDINCLSNKLPVLKNVRVGLIDPHTPKSEYSRTSNDGTTLELQVCSNVG